MKEVIVPNLPPPNGHYSHAMIYNGAAYLSGILPMSVKPEDAVKAQFDAVFDTIEEILAACRTDLSHTVNCRIYIADLENWPEINALYAARFKDHRPARVVVPVKALHFGYQLEVELMAALADPRP